MTNKERRSILNNNIENLRLKLNKKKTKKKFNKKLNGYL